MEADNTDITTERVVLALMLLDAASCADVSCKVTRDHFGVPIHKDIYKSILDLYKSGLEKIEAFTLAQTVLAYSEEAQTAKASHFDLTITSIFNVIRGGLEKESALLYVKTLDSIYRKRLLITYLDEKKNKVGELLTEQGVSLQDCITEVEAGLINKLSYDNSDDPEDVFKDLSKFALTLLEEKKDIVGLRTGFPILDDQIDGLEPGTLTVIAAPKKVGKSTVCMNIALNTAIDSEIPVLYIDTEMSTTKNKTRILSRITGIPEKRLKRGQVSSDERKTMDAVLRKMEDKVKFFHKYVPGFTLEGVLSLIRSYHLKHGIGLAIFDYIKVGAAEDLASIREYQLLGKMTIGLKDLAGILGIPILTAVQVGRSGDIADSDRIARYADTIVFFAPRVKEEIEEYGFEAGMYKFIVKLARSGGTTSDTGIGVHFNKPILSVFEAKKQVGFEAEDEVMNDMYKEGSEPSAEDDNEDISELAADWS